VIRSFQCPDTERLFHDENVRKFVNIRQPARRKLLMLHAAERLMDFQRVPPGNRLHQLEPDRAGQRRISINDQWRICFVWRDGDAYDVEITDYH